jgi:hypothetical protein
VPIKKLVSPQHIKKTQNSCLQSDEESDSSSSDSDSDQDREYGDASSSGIFSDELRPEGEDDAEGSEEEDEDEEEEEESLVEELEDINVFPSIDKYNRPKAFATYLKSMHQHSIHWRFPISDSEDSDDDSGFCQIPDSTPGLSLASSSPFPSSDALPSSPMGSSRYLLPMEVYEASSTTLSKMSKATFTPAPSHAPWQQLRLERIRRRMDKSKLKYLNMLDDSSGEEEVDELQGESATAGVTQEEEWIDDYDV